LVLDVRGAGAIVRRVLSIKITRSARAHAAACGAGSGGSYGANGGCSGFGSGGTFSSPLRGLVCSDIEGRDI
jgi:hypothetical protein